MDLNDKRTHFHEWLRSPFVQDSTYDGQDGPWCIAEVCSLRDLESGLRMPNCVAGRRDKVLYALGIMLEDLLTSQSDSRELSDDSSDVAMLKRLAIENWPELERIDVEYGFSNDFDVHVRPVVQKWLGS